MVIQAGKPASGQHFIGRENEVKVISQDLISSKHELRSALTELLNKR